MDNEFSLDLEKAMADTPLRDRSDISKGGMNDFIDGVVRNFMVEKIKKFPQLCKEARRVNKIYNAELEAHGNKVPTRMIGGKVYEGSSGWSKDGLFKHKWVVPMELMFFMRNCIYIKFWDDDNDKVRDSFMKALLRGDDALELLKKVRGHYGTNPDGVI